MPAEKISRKKLLKEPDEFISTTTKVIRFIAERRRRFIRYAVIVLIAMAAGAGLFFYLQWQQGKAMAIQGQALRLYEEAARKGTGTEGETETLRKAIEKFREAYAVSSRGSQAQISQMYIALCHFGLKEYDLAIAAYQPLLDGPLRPMALNGLGYTYEAKKDYAKALEFFKKIAQEGENPYQGQGFLGAARSCEQLNQRQEALEFYQKALNHNPKSPLADFLQRKIVELKGG